MIQPHEPTTFWVPLAELDLKEGAPVKKLTLQGGKTYSAGAASKFEPLNLSSFCQLLRSES